MDIQIIRHEDNGVLQGFTMYFNNTENKEVTMLVWDNVLKVWYSKTSYRGSCSVGVSSPDTQITVFSNDNHVEECQDFIQSNELVKFGEHYAAWHQQTDIRMIMHNNDIARLLKQYPAFNAFAEHTSPDGNYSYIYLNWIEPEHENLLVNYFKAVKDENKI
jgi:hypothetical protein